MNILIHLVKFFSEEAHANEFLSGSLYMNRLSHFKQMEGDDGRPDPSEAVRHWLQPHDLRLTINAPGIGEIVITGADLAGPVTIAPDFYNDLFLFCMTAVTADINIYQGKTSFNAEDLKAIRDQSKVHPDCMKFGDHAVIVKATEFITRVKTAVEKHKFGSSAGRVEYFEGGKFNGKFTDASVPFRKEKKYAYQNEFRITLDNGSKGSEPLLFQIGDISDICYKLKSSEINKTFNSL